MSTTTRHLVYQIFVDRFARPDGQAVPDPPTTAEPWRHHCGGTLDGIATKLDHIVSLGADALYLTPIFRAPSNHKYDTASYDEIDPHFGGDAAWRRLVDACRARDLGIILDGVFNHVGDEHPWFQAARRDPRATTASHFTFHDHPDKFACWRGYQSLPELALDRPEVASSLFDGPVGVVPSWIARGATGWRLDCANDLGHSICARAARAAQDAGAADGVVGEVMTYAEEWIREGRLDAVMNYYFRETVLGLCDGSVPPPQAAYNLKRMARAYRWDALLRSWNVLSTHDTPRLKTRLPDPRARALARSLAFTFPGVPLLYYGDEVGMEGSADPDNRRPMIWDETRWDLATLEHVRKLSALRRENPALRTGRYLPLPQPGHPSLLAFARVADQSHDIAIVAANAAPVRTSARLFAPYSYLFDALPLNDLLAGTTTRVSAGSFALDLEPFQVAILVPDDSTIPGYRFFRAR